MIGDSITDPYAAIALHTSLCYVTLSAMVTTRHMFLYGTVDFRKAIPRCEILMASLLCLKWLCLVFWLAYLLWWILFFNIYRKIRLECLWYVWCLLVKQWSSCYFCFPVHLTTIWTKSMFKRLLDLESLSLKVVQK